MADTCFVEGAVAICPGQTGACDDTTQFLKTHDCSGAASACLFGADAVPPSIKKQAVDDTKPGIGSTFTNGYSSSRIVIFSIVKFLQQSLAEGERSHTGFLCVGRRSSNTDGSSIAINQTDHLCFRYAGNGQ